MGRVYAVREDNGERLLVEIVCDGNCTPSARVTSAPRTPAHCHGADEASAARWALEYGRGRRDPFQWGRVAWRRAAHGQTVTPAIAQPRRTWWQRLCAARPWRRALAPASVLRAPYERPTVTSHAALACYAAHYYYDLGDGTACTVTRCLVCDDVRCGVALTHDGRASVLRVSVGYSACVFL